MNAIFTKMAFVLLLISLLGCGGNGPTSSNGSATQPTKEIRWSGTEPLGNLSETSPYSDLDQNFVAQNPNAPFSAIAWVNDNAGSGTAHVKEYRDGAWLPESISPFSNKPNIFSPIPIVDKENRLTLLACEIVTSPGPIGVNRVYRLVATRRDNTGWGPITVLDLPSTIEWMFPPKFAVDIDDFNRIKVAWIAKRPNNNIQIWAASYENNTWGVKLLRETSSYATLPKIVANNDGTIFCSWRESGTENTVYIASFQNSSWGAPKEI